MTVALVVTFLFGLPAAFVGALALVAGAAVATLALLRQGAL
jgi:hypothetical protein